MINSIVCTTHRLPSDISQMTSLSIIKIKKNTALSGTIASGWIDWEQERLRCINLQGNWLSGYIPYNLMAVTGLRYLLLKRNRFSGTIPRITIDPGTLRRIGITLSWNRLSGEIPWEDFSSISTLKYLGLLHNNLSGTIADYVSLPSLRKLYLSSNSLSGHLPRQNLPKRLTALFLANNRLSGTMPNAMGQSSLLTSLKLTNNDLDGTIPYELGLLTSMNVLSLESNGISGTLPGVICEWPQNGTATCEVGVGVICPTNTSCGNHCGCSPLPEN